MQVKAKTKVIPIRTDIKAGKAVSEYVSEFTQATTDTIGDLYTQVTSQLFGSTGTEEMVSDMTSTV